MKLDYIIDVSKPPIDPPGHVFDFGLSGLYETEASIDRNKLYKEYIKIYRDELKKMNARKDKGV